MTRRSSYIGVPSKSKASGLLVLEYQESSSIKLLYNIRLSLSLLWLSTQRSPRRSPKFQKVAIRNLFIATHVELADI